MSTPRFLVAISLLGVGCSGSSSLGSDQNPLTNAGAGGSTFAGAAGSAVAAGMGSGADGGTKAGGGTGGSSAGSAGKGTGATASAGTDPGSGGSNASAGTGGGSPSAGTDTGGGNGAGTGTGGNGASGGSADGGTSNPSGGSGGATGGTAGMDMGQAGEGPLIPDAPTKVDDPDATGDGPCTAKTARDVLDAIHEAYPELANIMDFYDPRYIGDPLLVYPYTSDAGFSMVLASGYGDCPGGCINWDYYYFQTDESCVPKQVGSYSAHEGPGNCYTLVGEPMWSMPDHIPTEVCP